MVEEFPPLLLESHLVSPLWFPSGLLSHDPFGLLGSLPASLALLLLPLHFLLWLPFGFPPEEAGAGRDMACASEERMEAKPPPGQASE